MIKRFENMRLRPGLNSSGRPAQASGSCWSQSFTWRMGTTGLGFPCLRRCVRRRWTETDGPVEVMGSVWGSSASHRSQARTWRRARQLLPSPGCRLLRTSGALARGSALGAYETPQRGSDSALQAIAARDRISAAPASHASPAASADRAPRPCAIKDLEALAGTSWATTRGKPVGPEQTSTSNGWHPPMFRFRQ